MACTCNIADVTTCTITDTNGRAITVLIISGTLPKAPEPPKLPDPETFRIRAYPVYAEFEAAELRLRDAQPPTQNHFRDARKMVGPRRVRGQVAGVHRALRFLRRPNCRGGLR